MNPVTRELLAEHAHVYACPVCAASMALAGEQGSRLACPENHSFDIAREGYVNLLLTGSSRSRRPGHTREMLKARRALFERRFFKPMLDTIEAELGAHTLGADRSQPLRVLDAGCGEGTVPSVLRARCVLPSAQFFGVDIAKDGIRAAAKRDTHVLWSVTNVQRSLPFQPGSFSLLLNILAPEDAAEFHRVLVPGGVLLKVASMPEHLIEFREAIYEAPRDTRLDDAKAIEALAPLFALHNRQRITYNFPMDVESTTALLDASPLTWKGKRAKVDALRSTGLSSVTVDLSLLRSVRKGESTAQLPGKAVGPCSKAPLR